MSERDEVREGVEVIFGAMVPAMNELIAEAGASGEDATAIRLLVVSATKQEALADEDVPAEKRDLLREVFDTIERMVYCGATAPTAIA